MRSLPRPRGDGPHPSTTTSGRPVSPPPTRGWSRRDRGHNGAFMSPRPRGDGPASRRRACRPECLPRPRGDGPSARPRGWQRRCLPRPRGDGPARSCVAVHGIVSPAHAGMVPQASKSSATGEVPPPTRGWSLQGIVRKADDAVSPAHAGMVRLATAPRSGWPVSPAHAGMVPSMRTPGRLLESPRPRGDGPLIAFASCMAAEFPRPRGDGPLRAVRQSTVASPPPTRGWSLGKAMTVVVGLPRPRGDGPGKKPGTGLPGGLPRPRGDGPEVISLLRAERSLPRPRGDGPLKHQMDIDQAVSPPPTRGWSRFGEARMASLIVSPAHAGIVPTAIGDGSTEGVSPAHAGMVLGIQSCEAGSLPRPRGDGPGSPVLRGLRDGPDRSARWADHWRRAACKTRSVRSRLLGALTTKVSVKTSLTRRP